MKLIKYIPAIVFTILAFILFIKTDEEYDKSENLANNELIYIDSVQIIVNAKVKMFDSATLELKNVINNIK